jgi:uncharacterized phage protein (TIGR02218 family)
MQQLTTELSNHLAQEVTTLATCWKITRKDGIVFCFTDHDADLVVEGETYLASSGITPSAVSSQLGLAVDNLELEGMLQNDGMSEADILAGKFDHAAVVVFMVNYTMPGDGKLHLTAGWLGEVSLKGGQFVAEIRGVSSLLQQSIGEVYTSSCRAKLGDARCCAHLGDFTVTGAVTSVEAAYSFIDASRTEDKNYFAYGLVTFTGGANSGLSMEVREFAAGKFTLFLPMPNAMAAGDTYTAVAGCDKLFDTCVGRFNNAVNFRGEPHVPGMDKILETSATRSK